MSEGLANDLLEAATSLNATSDLLEKFKKRELPPIARAHLSVACSGVLHARRQLELVLHALDPDRPGRADVSTEPPRRD